MDQNHPRLQKYQKDLEAHLEKVNLNLDNDIAELRLKITKADNEREHRMAKKAELNKEIEALKKEVDASGNMLTQHNNSLTTTRDKIEETKQEHQQVIKQLEHTKQEGERLREELENINEEINEIQSELRLWRTKGEAKEMKFVLEKSTEKFLKLQRKKAVQDSLIEKLRSDIRLAEQSIEDLEADIKKEIERKLDEESETADLQKKLEVFEKENTGLVDHFEQLVERMKEDENGDTSEENAQIDKIEKLKIVLSKNRDHLDRLQKSMQSGQEKMEKDKEAIQNHQKALQQLNEEIEEQKKELKLYDGNSIGNSRALSRTSSNSKLSNATALELRKRSLKLKQEHHNKVMQVLNQRKQSVAELSSSSGSKKASSLPKLSSQTSRSSSTTSHREKMKSGIINLKREYAALLHKRERLDEEEKILEEELKTNQALLDAEAQQLIKLESERATFKDQSHSDEKSITSSQYSEANTLMLKGKRDELKIAVKDLKTEISTEQSKLEEIKEDISQLKSKLATMSELDPEQWEHEKQEKQLELRRLKARYRKLTMSAREKQKELELCINQRDSTMGRAQSIVYNQTNIRAQREKEMEQLTQSIREKQNILKNLAKI